MSCAGRFLRPIRASLSALSSPSSSSSLSCTSNLCNGNYQTLKTWVKSFDPLLPCLSSRFYYQRKCIQKFSSSGRKLSMRSIFGISIVTGSLGLWRQATYAFDGNDSLTEEYHEEPWNSSNLLEDEAYTFLAFARKYWLPVVLVMTVVTGWTHPFTLVIKIILTLLSTKPNALSVYLFVEKTRRSMPLDSNMYNVKSLYAKKVDVEDYILLCWANIEIRDRKITLIGILGSWWVVSTELWPSYRIFNE